MKSEGWTDGGWVGGGRWKAVEMVVTLPNYTPDGCKMIH